MRCVHAPWKDRSAISASYWRRRRHRCVLLAHAPSRDLTTRDCRDSRRWRRRSFVNCAATRPRGPSPPHSAKPSAAETRSISNLAAFACHQRRPKEAACTDAQRCLSALAARQRREAAASWPPPACPSPRRLGGGRTPLQEGRPGVGAARGGLRLLNDEGGTFDIAPLLKKCLAAAPEPLRPGDTDATTRRSRRSKTSFEAHPTRIPRRRLLSVKPPEACRTTRARSRRRSVRGPAERSGNGRRREYATMRDFERKTRGRASRREPAWGSTARAKPRRASGPTVGAIRGDKAAGRRAELHAPRRRGRRTRAQAPGEAAGITAATRKETGGGASARSL